MTTTNRISPLILADNAALDTARMTLVDQLVHWARLRIEERVFLPGMRMPSIRSLAEDKGVSRFSVVEAYERLVAQGYLEARRGSGFYVRERPAVPPQNVAAPMVAQGPLDVAWLVRSMLHQVAPERGPGMGYLPPGWLDADMMTSAMRSMSRQSSAHLLQSGNPHGFLPLRMQLQTQLAELEIGARPEQIVLTSGITQAVDFLLRLYVSAGDTVLVGDPAWFVMFGRIASQGAHTIGVPYTPDGLDMQALERLVQQHRPKLLILNSILHNPTGTSLTPARAFQILRLAEQYDFMVLEDDIYCDLCPPHQQVARLASLDQLKRVIYMGSFSKTLAANLRVAFVACSPELAKTFVDHKMLSSSTTPEINERIVYKALTEGHYRRHVERLRTRLDEVRDGTRRHLERIGLRMFGEPTSGMFLWVDTGIDTNAIAAAGHEAGFLFAPGALFSPRQTPSTWMRMNITCSSDPSMLSFLSRQLELAA
ncbi:MULTISPECIES: PLP-dependent aminotransferase family protein [Pandoraea]|uniref:aminotransferase-like domain-containing protein n=1 Tax=Pandoraea TaxID=93217 RepID=UPI001F5CC24A|nr:MULTISPECIES: PLP-dependent aminotransferase family protein [Pandoraea]MCI3205754.1 GntR family transcriptional regulator [Pandoraea sp. LA3]MDN4583782.1 GntR family transcriptional regulator [Pandoraea capi]